MLTQRVVTHCHRTWCQWRGCCILHSLAIFLTNPSLPECVLSFTFCRVTTMSAATASRRELRQVFSSQQGYEILSLSRATFSARCARKWTRWRHVRCLRTFAVSTGCVLRTATAGFRCSCKFHIFGENNHLSSYTRKERRVLEAMTDRERRRVDWER